MADGAGAAALDGGELPLGGGLLALLRPLLAGLEPGGVVALRSRCRELRDDLPRWCRLEHHEYQGCTSAPDGAEVHRIARGSLGARSVFAEAIGEPPERLTTGELLAARPMPARADPFSGFAPRGASVEPGGPRYPFTLLERDHVAPPEIGDLYDQATAAQWDAARDIPWRTIRRLAPELDRAVGQVMSFLAENELSALYLPARFLPKIHPAYAEVAMFLATQLADEARHIDVFLKRAHLAGGPGVSAAATAQSLLTLLEAADFSEAAFLLSVLGEGTFLDLLRFVESHAPDEATAEIARRARQDESRHVHFGLAHVRHALARDPSLYARLEDAVRRRAAALQDMSGAPAPLQDALVLLAARAASPGAVARGHEAYRELLHTMHESRVRRLRNAGFSDEQAQTLSELHTANFM